MKDTSRTKVYRVTCTLGWRVYVERFKSAANAGAFVRAILGKEKPRWKSETKIVAKAADTLVIECDQLEEIMEVKSGTLTEDCQKKVKSFLFGVWKQGDNDEVAASTTASSGEKKKQPEQKKVTASGNGVISLEQLCEQHKWDARRVRQVLRKSGEKCPGSRWAWPQGEIVRVERKLEGLLK